MALAPEEVGRRIETARRKAGYASHQDFADAVGERLGHRVNLRTVQRWQKGRNPANGKSWLPRLPTLMELADMLEVPRSYFVEDDVGDDAGPDWLTPLRQQLEAEVERLRDLNDALEAELKPARPSRRQRER